MKIVIDYDIPEHIGSGACQHIYKVDEEGKREKIPYCMFKELLHGKVIVSVDFDVEHIVFEI